MRFITLNIYLFILIISVVHNECNAQNCPALNVVGSFNDIVSWPASYVDAQNEGHCVTFEPPYSSTLCFEYQVPFSDTVLFSLHLNACGSTSSINTGNFSAGCNSVSSGNATFTGMSTYDSDCNLIANSAQIGYCGGSVSGDILTICFNINTSTVCDPITICPTSFCGTSSCMTTLPIRLLSFNGSCKDGKNYLTWSTAAELNNDFFTVEQTTDGIIFQPVGTISGAGNSNEVLNYEFELFDSSPNQTKYYRLKQTDFDGAFSYSDIISVSCNESQFLDIFPNPSSDIVSLHTSSPLKGVTVINSIGKTVLNKSKVELVKETDIDVSSFAKGIYLLQVEIENGKILTEKLIVQ